MIAKMRSLFFWFYCLKIPDAVMLLLVCAVIFCAADRYLKHCRWWRWLCVGLLAALSVAAVYITVGSRGGEGDYHVYLIPFHTYRDVMNGANPELYRSNFMNAALFYPAGLLLTSLLPRKWPGWCRCLLTAVLFGAMSGAIEYAQYRYVLGNVEIDDVIHNTAGALAGSLAVLILSPIISRVLAKMRAWLQNE